MHCVIVLKDVGRRLGEMDGYCCIIVLRGIERRLGKLLAIADQCGGWVYRGGRARHKQGGCKTHTHM